MIRWLGLALMMAAAAAAQMSDTAKSDLAPITGRVLNAANGHAIVGAAIYYRGKGGTFDKEHHELNPSSLQGEVKSGHDGSFTIPDLPRGSFDVRAVAPGYFGAHDVLAAKVAGDKSPASISLSPDGVLRLQPDLLNLKPMAATALARLNKETGGNSGVSYPTPAFTPDGNRVAFLVPAATTFKSVTKEAVPGSSRCEALAYDLTNGNLTELNNSLPSNYCDVGSTKIAWEGELVYLLFTDYESSALKREGVRLQGGTASPVPVGDLPTALKEKQSRRASKWAAARGAREKVGADAAETTSDGRFTLKLGEGDVEQCDSLAVTASEPAWTQTVRSCSFPNDYMMDRNRDLLIFTEPGALVELNFKTRGQRRFSLPESELGPELLAFQALGNGATRMVYSVAEADCDPEGSPDSESGGGTEVSSVCFITIPAP